MDSKNTTKIDEQGKSRRGFIKKSSMVAGISVLPASNVWGVCNVSGVSGGSQAINQTCMVNTFIGGYSRSYWRSLVKDTPSDADIANFTFVNFDDPENDRRTNYPNIAKLIMTGDIDISGGGNIPNLKMNLLTAIKSGSMDEQLVAAIYINFIFGFVTSIETQYTGNSGNRAFLEHVWGSLHEGMPAITRGVVEGSFDNVGSISETDFLNMLNGAMIY